MSKAHHNMLTLIACLQGEGVIFRQQSLELKAGWQKVKAPKTLAMQEYIDNSDTCFYNDDINRPELLEELSLMMASKK
jgi:hypothetical protein